MGRFLEIGSYFPIPDGKGHWISKEICRFYSSILDLEITVPIGTVNDLASIPRILRGLFPVNGPHRPAAMVHDYLYEVRGNLPGRQLTRAECDVVFLEAMQSTQRNYIRGMSPFELSLTLNSGLDTERFLSDKPLVGKITANLMYTGVRIGGGTHWKD